MPVFFVYARRHRRFPIALNLGTSGCHRVASPNHRLVAFQNDQVSFRWKDYADGGKQKIMTVSADEFLRPFLIHTCQGLAPHPLLRAVRESPAQQYARTLPDVACFSGVCNMRRSLSSCAVPSASPMLVIEPLAYNQIRFYADLQALDPARCVLILRDKFIVKPGFKDCRLRACSHTRCPRTLNGQFCPRRRTFLPCPELRGGASSNHPPQTSLRCVLARNAL